MYLGPNLGMLVSFGLNLHLFLNHSAESQNQFSIKRKQFNSRLLRKNPSISSYFLPILKLQSTRSNKHTIHLVWLGQFKQKIYIYLFKEQKYTHKYAHTEVLMYFTYSNKSQRVYISFTSQWNNWHHTQDATVLVQTPRWITAVYTKLSKNTF